MKIFHEFIPKSYLYLRDYTLNLFKKDLVAGITVGIIALPLAMAFAIASGVTPDKGLFTAIIAGFLISAFGGSRVQIGGPTGAFVVIVYGIIQRTGYEGLALSTLIASALLVLFGVCRIGTWIKFVPYPLVTGFTTGIAVIIFSSQIKDFFGLQMGAPPADFVLKWIEYFKAFPTFHGPTLAVSASTLAVILAIRRFCPRIPWGIGAIVLATFAVWALGIQIETIQSKFGEIPRTLPIPSIPSLKVPLDKLSEICLDAITIALLGGIESLLSAVIADGMIGSRHKSNCELVAQGIANFGSVLFGGIPATGAIARTAANVKTGAQTPMAGIIHAITLFCIILFMSPIVSLIPLAALAAVLMMIAWNMSEMGHFIRLLRGPAGDMGVLLTAFFLTVLVDITVAILFGMVLASFLFMKRMSDFSKTVALTPIFRETQSEFPEKSDPDAIQNKSVPAGVEVYEIQGPFFFGAADMLQNLVLSAPPKVFILRMRHVPMVDASGAQALKEFYQRCQRHKTTLILSGVQGQTKTDLDHLGVLRLVGEKNTFPHIDAALAQARQLAE